MLDSYCAYNPSPLTLQQLVEFGRSATEVDSFNFVKQEVPVRLANIMKEINLLPPNLLQTPSVVTLQVRAEVFRFLLISLKTCCYITQSLKLRTLTC